MVGMKARFKPVDVLYSGDDFALVRSTLDTAEEVSKTQEQDSPPGGGRGDHHPPMTCMMER